MTPTLVEPASPDYPPALGREGSGTLPTPLCGLGNLALLRQPLTALLCSVRCPGSLILQAFDRAAQLRDAGRAVVSGFHTPVEKECLGILLRGRSPVVVCPARGLESFRMPATWKQPLAEGRLLVLS